MAVVEFVNGPRDTLLNLEKYKDELAVFKKDNENAVFTRSPSELIMGVETKRHGRMHKKHLTKLQQMEYVDSIKIEAGKEKCKYIMECFAKNAVGEKLSTTEPQPVFGVK